MLVQAKIVRQESLAIDAQFDKKRKQAETGWKMCVIITSSILLWADANAKIPIHFAQLVTNQRPS